MRMRPALYASHTSLCAALTRLACPNGPPREQVTNEIIAGIKIIKLYAWESSLGFKLDKIRLKVRVCMHDG